MKTGEFGTFNIFLLSGDEKFQACLATSCQVLLGVNILRGWSQDVGAVERAEGVHGHLLGLWVVPRHTLRGDQPGWPAGCSGHGSHEVQGRHCLWDPVLRGHPPDHRLQHIVGPPVPLQEPGPHRSSAAGSG